MMHKQLINGRSHQKMKIRIHKGLARNGFYNVWVTDDQNRQLHTEPLFLGIEKYHTWFFDWVKEVIESGEYDFPFIPLDFNKPKSEEIIYE